MFWGQAQQQTLYEDFLKTNGQWKRGLVWKEVINKHRGTTRGVRKWLTKTQLVAHFQSEKVAEAVVQRKRDTPGLQAEIRDHPELPGPYLRFHCMIQHIQKSISRLIFSYVSSDFKVRLYLYMFCIVLPGLEQFLVLTEDEEVQEEENLMTDMFKCQDAASSASDDSESSSTPKKKKVKGKGSKGGKKKGKNQKKSKKNKKKNKKKKSSSESDDPEKKQLAEAEKATRKARTVMCLIWTMSTSWFQHSRISVFQIDCNDTWRQSGILPIKSKLAMWRRPMLPICSALNLFIVF